jgi:hypothetical protein
MFSVVATDDSSVRSIGINSKTREEAINDFFDNFTIHSFDDDDVKIGLELHCKEKEESIINDGFEIREHKEKVSFSDYLPEQF